VLGCNIVANRSLSAKKYGANVAIRIPIHYELFACPASNITKL
jgi:hypothetical protein